MKFNVNDFTVEEKLKLLSGYDGWRLYMAEGKLPEVRLCDGPSGLRDEQQKATAMPTISVLANTWSREMARLDGATIADDCVEKGATVLLAPGVNIKRTPLCGRNFEYFSEDPYLAGTLGKEYISAVQEKGVGTSLKHFCANNREHCRLSQSNEIDERTLREIYMRPFEIALQAKPWTVMCAYNMVNGVYASENKKLLKDVLRDEFGFDGVILSDWCATQNAYRAFKASLDVSMPASTDHYETLKRAYDNGWITDEELNERAANVLRLIEKCANAQRICATDKETRHKNAVTVASEGIVLLKNEEGILPFNTPSVAVVGKCAVNPPIGGGGSSNVHTDYKQIPLAELLQERMPTAKVTFGDTFNWSPRHTQIMNAAYTSAYHADTVLLCVGTDNVIETEEADRETIRLPLVQEELILRTAKVNPNVVVAVYAGSAIDMSAWIDKVKAVVFVGFAGEGGNEALADVLTGKVNPSGKLAETFPLCLADTPTGSTHGNSFVERYSEGVFVGYRYYDAYEKEVLFPFGHGLSYTKFSYSDMEIAKRTETDYEVSFTVKNEGDTAGKEVCQLYVKDVFAPVSRPEKELKGFTKIALAPGQSKRVTLTLDARSFAYYDVVNGGWRVDGGEYELLVGASSRDIRLTEKLSLSFPENEQFSQYFNYKT